MREKRTNPDFSKHKHSVEIFKNDKGGEIRVDHFKIDGTRMNYIKFINTNDILSVTGDYGNWIFCRPFVPSSEGAVSDGYWYENLSYVSTQKAKKYDPDKTYEEIEKLIESGLEKYGYEGEELEELKEWFSELKEYCYDEYEYIYHAYRAYDVPNSLDINEIIPFETEFDVWLLIIFDAFDEICTRLKNKENEKEYYYI